MRHNDDSNTVDVRVIGPKTMKDRVLTGLVTDFAKSLAKYFGADRFRWERDYAPSCDAKHDAFLVCGEDESSDEDEADEDDEDEAEVHTIRSVLGTGLWAFRQDVCLTVASGSWGLVSDRERLSELTEMVGRAIRRSAQQRSNFIDNRRVNREVADVLGSGASFPDFCAPLRKAVAYKTFSKSNYRRWCVTVWMDSGAYTTWVTMGQPDEAAFIFFGKIEGFLMPINSGMHWTLDKITSPGKLAGP
ncbi:hypothetical protein SPRG_04423 [Saprolegnia parasitica CBS 223.65]|uniref:Uncharacterized protein n=1 Tax=Saprolegnia parasitica (strain CBS 223.65) TaxID=695850 RepID=A0A067CUQ2_SAPPC|nr:hypothetical protein SPRG_04423 [Saprolegnia parasitica CBS 223.65]KDO30522.1 hypothetical protein SPRG_04423 [Saprolegnia parasitica CBS 223.65]|eukprot:XP_012198737.1 hypothetical protein SPRG_04423 [Saprolegnia parasitica CBS 223.65]